MTSLHVAEEVCSPVAHRQVVLTIPKRLRVHTRFDRQLLGKLSSCAWTCLKAEARRLLGRDDVVPGMIGAIQTHGQLLHWHPHLHVLITCGAWTPEGERLIQYMTRCPFSLSRLVKVSDTGQVIYQSEKQVCRAFPDPKGDGMRAGVPRNFQILEPLDFLAEFTQHIPPKGAHLIR